MAFTFKPAVREALPLILGLAGPTGSGKTMSAFRLAAGLSGGRRFAVIDTEAGRALHYAPSKTNPNGFAFDHAELRAPFSPDAYTEAILAADAAGYPVIVVDSASHEWAGEGGCMDMHDALLDEIVERKREQADKKGWNFDEWKTRDANTLAAWGEPKKAHKRMVSRLLQLRAHVILCLRAEDKIEITKDANDKTVIRPMETLTGYRGMIPICEKRLPFELTMSLVFSNEKPGVPIPIKLNHDHRALVSLEKPITEEVGKALGEWASGGVDYEASLRAATDMSGLGDAWRKIPAAKQKLLAAVKDECKANIEAAIKAAEGTT